MIELGGSIIANGHQGLNNRDLARYSLSWVTSDGKNQSFVGDQPFVTLGRGITADVQIDDPTVSSLHARLSRQGAGLVIEDLASRNGLTVNSQRIRTVTPLKDGDVIELGGVRATFNIEGAKPAKPAAQSQARRLTAPPIAAAAIVAPPAPQRSDLRHQGDPEWCICPVCRNSQTAKLTAIVKSGAWSSAGAAVSVGYIHTAHGSIPTSQVTGTRNLSATFLAQIAAPPVPPVLRVPPLGTILICIGGVVTLFAVMSMTQNQSQVEQSRNTGFAFVWLILGLAALGFGIFQHLSDRRAAQQDFNQTYAHWQQAMAAHDRLFYCDRCDTVFDAATRMHRPADLAFQLLG